MRNEPFSVYIYIYIYIYIYVYFSEFLQTFIYRRCYGDLHDVRRESGILSPSALRWRLWRIRVTIKSRFNWK